jgi:hypothetical protein
MVVTEQNTEGPSSDGAARLGREVRLAWRRDNTLSLLTESRESQTTEAAS